VTASKQLPALSEFRRRIDELDREVLELLAKRMRVVADMAAVKRAQGVPIQDPQRERELLDDRGERAQSLGLAPGSIESIYREIMLASRDYQAMLGAAASTRGAPKEVAIIGGAGRMGKLMALLFRQLGHRVVVADLATEVRPEQAAASADVVLIAVPIQITTDVIEELGPRVREDALLMDVTSLKRAPLAAMLQHSRASVAGTHPMFGPGVRTLGGQRVVVCPGRGREWCAWLEQTLGARGLVVTRATAEEHDRAMALVQVLTHFQTQVHGWTLARFGVPLERLRRFTSPAYLLELAVAAQHFGHDPLLYGPIQILNPDTRLVTSAFRSAAEELSEIVGSADQVRFNQMFQQVRAFLGDALEAIEPSRNASLQNSQLPRAEL
jgi:chorismate mutase / prephenate dehydrogenase